MTPAEVSDALIDLFNDPSQLSREQVEHLRCVQAMLMEKINENDEQQIEHTRNWFRGKSA